MAFRNVVNAHRSRERMMNGDHVHIEEFSERRRRQRRSLDNNKIKFNICGSKFEVLERTIQRYPDTLLANKEKMQRFWDDEEQEYFLDRNRACFEAVLTYYQHHGILACPPGIPEILFELEVRFYELGDDALQKIHRKRHHEHRTKKTKPKLPKNELQRKIWTLFEYPESSRCASCVAWLSFALILLSVVVFCVETLPEFRQDEEAHESASTFFIIEAICICWFTLEYSLRLFSSPSKQNFVKDPLNMIDLIAILPFYIGLALNNGSNISTLAILRAVRLVRVIRIFKLSRYSTGLQILGKTVRESLSEIGLLLFFLCLGVILFGSAVYYAENNANGSFRSIPHSFWWAIVTMTTVGYGDMYPVTIGKIIGSMCACSGIMAIALPVPVIVANFERYYSRALEQARLHSEESRKTYEKSKALRRFLGRFTSTRRSVTSWGRRRTLAETSVTGGTEEATSPKQTEPEMLLADRDAAEETV